MERPNTVAGLVEKRGELERIREALRVLGLVLD
jgi:hypothetical protein